jgi:hypothetical protein
MVMICIKNIILNQTPSTDQFNKADLAMLHDVKLPQPRLIKRIAGGMNDVTQPILLRQDEHGVQQTFHGIARLD